MSWTSRFNWQQLSSLKGMSVRVPLSQLSVLKHLIDLHYASLDARCISCNNQPTTRKSRLHSEASYSCSGMKTSHTFHIACHKHVPKKSKK